MNESYHGNIDHPTGQLKFVKQAQVETPLKSHRAMFIVIAIILASLAVLSFAVARSLDERRDAAIQVTMEQDLNAVVSKIENEKATMYKPEQLERKIPRELFESGVSNGFTVIVDGNFDEYKLSILNPTNGDPENLIPDEQGTMNGYSYNSETRSMTKF